MEKRDFPVSQVRRYLEPGPIVLVSSKWKGKTNIMTMGWHTVMEFTPSLAFDPEMFPMATIVPIHRLFPARIFPARALVPGPSGRQLIQGIVQILQISNDRVEIEFVPIEHG